MVKDEDPESRVIDLLRDKGRALNKKDFKEAAKCCNYLGVNYAQQGKYEESLEAHKEELELCEKTKDRLGVAVAHRMIGESLAYLGSFKTSVEHLREYMKIALDLNDKEEIQRAETTLGRVYWVHYNADTEKNRKSLDKAEHFHKNALARAIKLKGSIPERDFAQMRCRCLLNLALVYDVKSDKIAVKLLETAIELTKKYGFADDHLRCLTALMGYHIRSKSMSLARGVSDEAIQVAKKLKDYTSLCEITLTKACILINLVDYDGARHLYKQAYHWSGKSTDPEHKMKAVKGCKLTKKIIEALKEVNLSTDLENHYKLYDKIADYCVDLNCYSMAIDYYNRVLDAALKLGKSHSELALIYFSLGQTYFDNKQYREALKAYAKELPCRAGSPDDEIHCLLKMIEIKIILQQSFDEIQREYEFTLTKCDTDKLKRLVLKDYKQYLEDSKAITFAKKDIERQLEKLGPEQEETEMECESDNEHCGENSDGEISDLTDESDNENGEEMDTKGRSLRTRRTAKSNFKVNEKGESALHRACIDGNLSHVIKLIESGHEVNIRDHAGWLPIHEAANHGYADIVQYLIDKKCALNDRGGVECGDTTPIHDACANGHIDVIRVLLRANANVICRNENGDTPFDLLKERIGDGKTLTSTQKKDVVMLYKEIKRKMKEQGFDFNAKFVKKAKRKHISSDIIGKPVNNVRTRVDRSPSRSPPRKALKSNKVREAHDAKNAYKEVISNLRRPHDLPGGPPPAKSKSKFKGLIDESEYVVDEWMINDLKPSALKDKPALDAYEMTDKLLRKSKEVSGKKSTRKRSAIAPSIIRAHSDEEEDFVVIENDREEKNNRSGDNSDNEVEEAFDWNERTNGKGDSDNEDDDDIEIISKKSKSRKIIEECMETSLFSTTSPPPDLIPLSSPTPSHYHPSTSSFYTPPVIPSYKTVSPPSTAQKSGPNQVPTKTVVDQPVNPSNQANEKFLVTVHLEDKKFLLAVPNRSIQVSWLAEKTAERYYQMRQLRPKLSLATEDGAILDLEDLIVDVCLDNKVHANIESWDLEPLPERYESNCKFKKCSVNCDLKFKLKLCETSGKLQLNNMLLGPETISAFLSSLRCQKSLRILDFSFSDIILLDKDDTLSQILSTLPDLEEVNFKGTGLVSYRLDSLCRNSLTNLFNIDLSYNHLDDKCSANLIELIRKCPNLRQIDLRCNDFSFGFSEKDDIIQISQEKNINLLIK